MTPGQILLAQLIKSVTRQARVTAKESFSNERFANPRLISRGNRIRENRVKIAKARRAAHLAFDQLWQRSDGFTRNTAYVILQRLMDLSPEEAHIAKFTPEQCDELIRKLQGKKPDDFAIHALRLQR